MSQKNCNNPRNFFLASSQCCQSKSFQLVTKLQSLASSGEKMKLIPLTVFKIWIIWIRYLTCDFVHEMTKIKLLDDASWGIKQYNNKLIRLIELVKVHTVKWYKFQTPTALPSTWLPSYQYLQRWALNGSDACNHCLSLPINLTVILLVILLARFHSNGFLCAWSFEKSCLLTGSFCMHLFNSREEK